MQISKRNVLIIAKATAKAVGLIHPGAEVVLTWVLAFCRILYDKEMPVQQARVEQRVPLSKRHLFIIGEATAKAVGLIHPGAGVVFTWVLAFCRILYDKEMPVQQARFEQRVPHPVPIAQKVAQKKQESDNRE